MAIFEWIIVLLGVFGIYIFLIFVFWFIVTGMLDKDLEQKIRELFTKAVT